MSTHAYAGAADHGRSETAATNGMFKAALATWRLRRRLRVEGELSAYQAFRRSLLIRSVTTKPAWFHSYAIAPPSLPAML